FPRVVDDVACDAVVLRLRRGQVEQLFGGFDLALVLPPALALLVEIQIFLGYESPLDRPFLAANPVNLEVLVEQLLNQDGGVTLFLGELPERVSNGVRTDRRLCRRRRTAARPRRRQRRLRVDQGAEVPELRVLSHDDFGRSQRQERRGVG